ncbi:response regulator [bacterium]|nr:response regulator [bacterium]
MTIVTFVKRINNRISTRIGLFFGIFMLISFSAIGYFGYDNAREAHVQNSIDRSVENVDKLISLLNAYLNSSISDLHFLTDFYALKRFIAWNDIGEPEKVNYWRNVTYNAFESFLYSKKRYAQMRFLAIDGQEQIRLNYDDKLNKVSIVKENRLQNKKHRPYFIRTMELVPGTIFVSPFNLNREFGKIVYPYQSTIRYSMPVIDTNGTSKGIVVVNLFGDNMMKLISTLDNNVSADNYFLLNKDGFYLYHSEESKVFGFDRGSEEVFGAEYPVASIDMMQKDSGTITENGQIISYKRIYPSGVLNENYMFVVNIIPQKFALEKLRQFEWAFVVISILFFVGIVFLLRYLYSTLAPLHKVSEHLQDLANGRLASSKINYKSNDEVGTIVHSTNIMVEGMRATIAQANAIAQGDFSLDVMVHSDEDQLNNALNDMTQRLRTIASISDTVAQGENAKMLVPNSERDQLTKSINGMITYLSEIKEVSSAIAIGDYTRDFTLRGMNDSLGRTINQMVQNLREVLAQTAKIADGDFNTTVQPRSEKDQLSAALMKMTDVLAHNHNMTVKDNFIKDGISELSKKLSGDIAADMIANESITHLCRYLNGASGVIYYYDESSEVLQMQASFSFSKRNRLGNRIGIGEGVVGQVALEKKSILLTQRDGDDHIVDTGLLSSKPVATYTFALLNEKQLVGVAEIAYMENFTENQIDFIEQAASVIATFIISSGQNEKIKELLDKSQRDYEELQLKSEELQQTNVQMEEQAQQMKMQSDDMKKQNHHLAATKANLDKQAEELMQASRYKSEFLANMSHELRTPLNSVILLSKMLRDGLDDAQNSKKASVIHDAGNDLLSLINDILDLSKIEAGQMEVDVTTISSQNMGVALYELFEPVSEDKKVEFIIRDELNSNFDTDLKKLTQILKNLISNAFKFTKKGNVVLHMYSDEKGELNFAVVDTGIGIPKNKLTYVFEAFKQGDGSVNRVYGGTGLGLSISLRFAQLLGGELLIDSKEGEGSTFTLRIPVNQKIGKKQILAASTIPTASITPIASTASTIQISPIVSPVLLEDHSTPDLADKGDDSSIEKAQNYSFSENTILLVDDDSRNIFTLSALFQEAGASTLHALNGLEALDILESNSKEIDLILMDIMMPKMNGYEAMEKIRKNKIYDKIPIIAVTAKAMAEDRQKCLDAGANDYVTKPINENTLTQLSRLWIDKMA